ncbi:hypothetical protein Ccar_03685 [Clostridium carboxidivorans P7]|uniref:RNA polymerase sigma factor, sigma-70 family n=1 Tax=Clostridium carboxidivorans P7 TaxID=536227 RepID=C6PP31_9CLOT|nr:sigma-70 family RNA polymerase sigma factor [Clostridium carboxidivorans]AKN29980.1 hypothetical protein Ccar_03685 [Clostridium carboxidivorans P7]EET88909.1 RNA polymerase sigma factor, sigma-70 family [Clostridium carboxidivorans P7]
MNFYNSDLKNFIEKIRNEDEQAITQLHKNFEGFILEHYNSKIGTSYGNKYFQDYLSDLNISMFNAVLNFNGTTKSSFRNYMCQTISNCLKKVSRDNCKPQYNYKYLDNEDDLKYIEKTLASGETSIFNNIFFKEDLIRYLRDKLNSLEIELFECIFYKRETLKYFAETHNLNYSSVRSTFFRMRKKIEYKKIKSLLELKHSLFLFMACIIGGCL